MTLKILNTAKIGDFMSYNILAIKYSGHEYRATRISFADMHPSATQFLRLVKFPVLNGRYQNDMVVRHTTQRLRLAKWLATIKISDQSDRARVKRFLIDCITYCKYNNGEMPFILTDGLMDIMTGRDKLIKNRVRVSF